jgi:hypothetical protein
VKIQGNDSFGTFVNNDFLSRRCGYNTTSVTFFTGAYPEYPHRQGFMAPNNKNCAGYVTVEAAQLIVTLTVSIGCRSIKFVLEIQPFHPGTRHHGGSVIFRRVWDLFHQ